MSQVEKEGWKVCMTESLSSPTRLRKSTPNTSILHRLTLKNSVKLINHLLPHQLWEYITQYTELRRQALLGEMITNPSQIHHFWQQEITTSELRNYFGCVWFWESVYTSYSYDRFYATAKNDFRLVIPRRFGIISYVYMYHFKTFVFYGHLFNKCVGIHLNLWLLMRQFLNGREID